MQDKLLLPRLARQTGGYREPGLPEHRLSSGNAGAPRGGQKTDQWWVTRCEQV